MIYRHRQWGDSRRETYIHKWRQTERDRHRQRETAGETVTYRHRQRETVGE